MNDTIPVGAMAILATIRASTGQMTEPARLEDWASCGLMLANMGTAEDSPPVAWFFAYTAKGIRFGKATPPFGNRQHLPRQPELLASDFKRLAPLRDWLTRIFRDVIADSRKAARMHAEVVRGRVQRMAEFGLLDFREGVLTTKPAVVADSAEDATGYIAALYLDESLKFGKSLRQCQLQECPRFFLPWNKSPGNSNAWCSPKHTEEGKRLQARERARKYRKDHARKPK